ncbi:hypothetical protein RDWZM_009919 [Blomia tropicalis]|uniref:Exostosin-2-like n=1 Tax=Blomia tropicalis TaxID=40697 RepID=A0A9Q0LY24_BLOTA|nr:hypothetical protein RDWZM_009919 [Blomia tropicalis]
METFQQKSEANCDIFLVDNHDHQQQSKVSINQNSSPSSSFSILSQIFVRTKLFTREKNKQDEQQPLVVVADNNTEDVNCFSFSIAIIFILFSFLLLFGLNPSLIYGLRKTYCDHYHQYVTYSDLDLSETFLNYNSTSLDQILHLVLRNHSDSPQLKILETNRSSFRTNRLRKCSHYSCFDIYRCGMPNFNSHDLPKHLRSEVQERIKVYVYPSIQFVLEDDADEQQKNRLLSIPFSSEFSRILQSIVTSQFYTSNISESCLFVINLDLLNWDLLSNDPNLVERILWSLPTFSQTNGANHLLISMRMPLEHYDWSHFGIDIGDAIIAGAGFDLDHYRAQFDISIPVYSVLSQLYENQNLHLSRSHFPKLIERKRKWNIIVTELEHVTDDNVYEKLKQYLAISSPKFVHFKTCENNRTVETKQSLFKYRRTVSTDAIQLYNESILCSSDDDGSNDGYHYLDLLQETEFCIIPPTIPLATPLLSDSLMAGCIPILITDDYVLPLEERIDWSSISVRIWSHQINELVQIVDAIKPSRRREMRINCLYVWYQYFGSLERIALTTIEIINERIYPKPKRLALNDNQQQRQLNQFTLDYYSMGYNVLTPKQSFLQLNTAGFTAVILTYNRLESLFEVIQSVARVPSCVKIVIVWNNPAINPPAINRWPTIMIPIQVIRVDSNRLSNRFYPYASIETDSVFAIDDDITMLNMDEIEFAYQTWREFPDRIVGFPSRLHLYDNFSRQWQYDSEWKNQFSMILTGAAFYHSYYNHLYTYVMQENIRKYVDNIMNCEDLAMNFMVSNITRSAPIKVTPRKKFKCPECRQNHKLSTDAMQHLRIRSQCIDHFVSIYKMLPLKAVEYRSNPVLYRDNIPDKLKHYNSVGTL